MTELEGKKYHPSNGLLRWVRAAAGDQGADIFRLQQ